MLVFPAQNRSYYVAMSLSWNFLALMGGMCLVLFCPSSGNIAKKKCFLVCPPSVNMARKQCILVCPSSGNMARKQCFLVCPPGKMYPHGLSSFRKHGLETMFPALSTFRKND